MLFGWCIPLPSGKIQIEHYFYSVLFLKSKTLCSFSWAKFYFYSHSNYDPNYKIGICTNPERVGGVVINICNSFKRISHWNESRVYKNFPSQFYFSSFVARLKYRQTSHSRDTFLLFKEKWKCSLQIVIKMFLNYMYLTWWLDFDQTCRIIKPSKFSLLLSFFLH